MKLKITALVFAIIVVLLSVYIYKGSKGRKDKSTEPGEFKKPTAAELEEGKNLVAKSDCLSCHKLDIKLIGPAYKDIAVKYPANDSNYHLLVQKIINGGNGVWGPVAMSPHPDLPIADATRMVQYILTIK